MPKPEDMSVDELWDKYQRALATIENMRKSHRVALLKAEDRGSSDAIRTMLPIVDNLERACEQSEKYRGQGEAVDHLKDGISAVATHARGTLAGIGVNPFSCEYEEFDPSRMDAIARTPTNELEPGRVFGVHERGYTIEDRVLRPAKVAVSVLLEEENA